MDIKKKYNFHKNRYLQNGGTINIQFTFLDNTYIISTASDLQSDINDAIITKISSINNDSKDSISRMINIERNEIPSDMMSFKVTINPGYPAFDNIPSDIRLNIANFLNPEDLTNYSRIDKNNRHKYFKLQIQKKIEQCMDICPEYDKDILFRKITPDDAYTTVLYYDINNKQKITIHKLFNNLLYESIKYNRIDIVHRLLDIPRTMPHLNLFVEPHIIMKAIYTDNINLLNDLKRLLGTFKQFNDNNLKYPLPLKRDLELEIKIGPLIIASHNLYDIRHGRRRAGFVWLMRNYIDLVNKIGFDRHVDPLLSEEELILYNKSLENHNAEIRKSLNTFNDIVHKTGDAELRKVFDEALGQYMK